MPKQNKNKDAQSKRRKVSVWEIKRPGLYVYGKTLFNHEKLITSICLDVDQKTLKITFDSRWQRIFTDYNKTEFTEALRGSPGKGHSKRKISGFPDGIKVAFTDETQTSAQSALYKFKSSLYQGVFYIHSETTLKDLASTECEEFIIESVKAEVLSQLPPRISILGINAYISANIILNIPASTVKIIKLYSPNLDPSALQALIQYLVLNKNTKVEFSAKLELLKLNDIQIETFSSILSGSPDIALQSAEIIALKSKTVQSHLQRMINVFSNDLSSLTQSTHPISNNLELISFFLISLLNQTVLEQSVCESLSNILEKRQKDFLSKFYNDFKSFSVPKTDDGRETASAPKTNNEREPAETTINPEEMNTYLTELFYDDHFIQPPPPPQSVQQNDFLEKQLMQMAAHFGESIMLEYIKLLKNSLQNPSQLPHHAPISTSAVSVQNPNHLFYNSPAPAQSFYPPPPQTTAQPFNAQRNNTFSCSSVVTLPAGYFSVLSPVAWTSSVSSPPQPDPDLQYSSPDF